MSCGHNAHSVNMVHEALVIPALLHGVLPLWYNGAMTNLLTVYQAATRLGITGDGVMAAIRRGAMAAERLGSFWVITPQEVERYRRDSLGKPGRRLAPRSAAQPATSPSPKPMPKPASTPPARRRPDDDYYDDTDTP